MSDDKTDTDAPKKKGGVMKKALMVLVLLGAGGGGTYGAFAMGMLGEAVEIAYGIPLAALGKNPFFDRK